MKLRTRLKVRDRVRIGVKTKQSHPKELEALAAVCEEARIEGNAAARKGSAAYKTLVKEMQQRKIKGFSFVTKLSGSKGRYRIRVMCDTPKSSYLDAKRLLSLMVGRKQAQAMERVEGFSNFLKCISVLKGETVKVAGKTMANSAEVTVRGAEERIYIKSEEID